MANTIARPFTIDGVGLHSGRVVRARFKPAHEPGVRFHRVDLPESPAIPADLDHVSGTDRRTELRNGPATVSTVEHVLAAISGCGVDQVEIELDGPEPPIADGSAEPFQQAIVAAGLLSTGFLRQTRCISHRFEVTHGESRYIVSPSDRLVIRAVVEWAHPSIGRQDLRLEIEPHSFAAELAPARTFGFLSEYEELKSQGLALGASEENVIVLDDEGVVNGPLRWPDEFVRHKMIDLLGDLSLVGGPIRAEIAAHKPSHRGNVKVAERIKELASVNLDVVEIMKIMPHRYPMLLVDRIVELEEGARVVGLKNVTINEPFFQGHFPGHPVMPGVLIVEAMAQAGGMLLMGSVDDPGDKVVYFMSLDKVKFRRPVVPGDQLRLEVEMVKFRGKTCQMKGTAFVEGKPVAEAEMMARIMDR